MLKAVYSKVASLEEQWCVISTLLFVSAQENSHSVSEGATDDQEGQGVPIVQVHPCCIPWEKPGELVPRPRT